MSLSAPVASAFCRRISPVPALAPPVEATLVALARGCVAAFFDSDAAHDRRARIACQIDGRAVTAPFAATTLPRAGRGSRHVALLSRPLEAILGRQLLLSLGGQPAASVEADWLQPPVGDMADLLAGLAEGASDRLLKLLLTAGPSLLGPEGSLGFGGAMQRLLELSAARVIPATTVTPLGLGCRLISYELPAGTGPVPAGLLVLSGPRSVTRLKGLAAFRQSDGAGDVLHLLVPGRLPPEAELVLPGSTALRLQTVAPIVPLAAWIGRQAAPARDWILGHTREGAGSVPLPSSLAREIDPLSRPAELVLQHLSATLKGVLYCARLVDPDGLVQSIRFERGGKAVEIASKPGPGGSASLAGLLPLHGPATGGDACRVQLLHGSGTTRRLPQVVLRRFEGAVPLGLEEASEEALAAGRPNPIEVFAQAQLSLPSSRTDAATWSFGIRPTSFALSVVAPLGGRPDLLRARAAVVAQEAGAARAEIVCVVEEGPGVTVARRLSAEAAAIFGLHHKVIAVESGATPAACLRAGLAHSEGQTSLWLGAELLPAREGWLAHWRAQLAGASAPDAITAPIIDHEGAASVAWPERADLVGFSAAGRERLLAMRLGHPNPVVHIAALEVRVRHDVRGGAIRYGAPPEETSLAAVLRRAAVMLGREDRP